MQLLVRDATQEELRDACVDNHLVWLRRLTEASGGSVRGDRLVWATTREPEPEVTVAVVGEPRPSMRAEIDEIVGYCRTSGIERLSFWTADEPTGDRLAPWLEARGLRRGEQPHWMAVDLHSLPPPASAETLAAKLDVTMPTRFDDWTVPELVCFGPDTWRARQEMVSRQPQRVWHGVLWEQGRPVGQLSFNLTEGDLGVMGLHNFLILRDSRVQGPGLDRFDWVIRFGLEHGCRYLVANALERAVPLYRLMNFKEVGVGRTWWSGRDGLATALPEAVLLGEAIGEGDIATVQQVVAGWTGAALDRPLANGMTPLQFSGQYRQPQIARWLLSHGATPDVLALWDLGWRDEARDVLVREPSIVLARRPRSGKTLLHMAVERNDADLVTMLLRMGADPGAQDSRYGSTPEEWAVVLRRTRLAATIRSVAADLADA